MLIQEPFDPQNQGKIDAKSTPRMRRLSEWVKAQFPGLAFEITSASSDASFRRYFRVTLADRSTRIVMDAPPEHEDCRPFLHVAELFAAAGAHVPHVYAANPEEGFLLLADLGNTSYLAALEADRAGREASERARTLYREACAALIALQGASRPGALPDYDRALLLRELRLFPEWYVGKHLGISLSAAQETTLSGVFDALLENALAQPQVFVHRDYHSRNLMLTETRNPGILDFQDAVVGPITYDLVSLLRDAYIDWEEEQELDWAIRYWEAARRAALPVRADFSEFWRDYEWMGVQRQLKVLGIFARLFYRDGKELYLQYLPRVMGYLRRASERYAELRPLPRLIDEFSGRQPAVALSF